MDFDTRHPVLNNGLDDRKESESRPGGIERGRAGPINHFISADKRCMNMYNDKRYTINKKMKKYLWRLNKEQKIGLDHRLMNHFADILVRDNICIYEDDFKEEKIIGNTNHFEAYQSTNWNNVRFKPPPSLNSDVGWRVEFRPLEGQLTQDQNFLFSHAAIIFERIITSKNMRVNFYIPMSLVN